MMKNEDFKGFYERYYEFSLRLALKMVKNRVVAEDISQDVFCSLYKYKDKIDTDNEKKVHALVITVTVNKCKDYLKRAYVKAETPLEDEFIPKGQRSRKNDVEAAMLYMEKREYLKLVFQKLRDANPMNYDIFVKTKVMDFTAEAVAQEYGITTNNVNNRILRTRLWIKKELAKIYGSD